MFSKFSRRTEFIIKVFILFPTSNMGEARNVYRVVYKICVCLAIAPAWNFEENTLEKGRVCIFQSVILAMVVYGYLIYGDIVEYALEKPASDQLLYSVIKCTFMAVFLQILCNRYNKHWRKLLKFVKQLEVNNTETMKWQFILENSYFFVVYILEAVVWLNIDSLKSIYCLHFPVTFIIYMNLAQTSLIFNFLILMNENFKKIDSDIAPLGVNTVISPNSVKLVRVRYGHALKGCQYLNKLFGITFLFQVFLSTIFLVDSFNFITLQYKQLSISEYITLCVIPIIPMVGPIILLCYKKCYF